MKRILAILLVALVALTSVFAVMASDAGTKKLTLTDNIESKTTWKLQYKIGNDGAWLDLDENKEEPVSLDKNGSVGIQVLLNTNTSEALSRTFKITTEGFKRVEGDNRVNSGLENQTRFTVTPTTSEENLYSSSLSNGEVTVSVNPFTRFGVEKQVLVSTLSWDGKSDLIAGDYEAVIKVEYSAE